ncbi:S1C family serine protease [Herbiconiux liukaitaii]|uniref:S1C family serine protease n=1 Tax=Herbiconiux liukaitaii TaxID=3342799 RepID=UPI0035B8CE38
MSDRTENPENSEGIPAESSTPVEGSTPAAPATPATPVAPTTPAAPTASGTPTTPVAPTTPAHDATTAVVPPVVPPVQAEQPTAPTTPQYTQPTQPYSQTPSYPQQQAPAQPYGQQSTASQATGHQPTQPYGTQQPAQAQPTQAQPTQQQPAQAQPTQPYAAQTANYGNGSFGTPTQGGTAYGAVPDPTFNSAMYAASGAHTDQARAPKPKKRRGGVALVAALAIGALIGGASGAGVTAWVTNQSGGGSSSTASSPSSITVNDPDDATQVTAVAAKASPSVVTISVSSDAGAGTGSGVILSEDGYVVTNTHVVTLDGAASTPTIQVQTDDGRLFVGTIVGTDPVADLAVIKLTDASGLTPIEFADSSELNVGDTTIAIGAPLGLAGTVTDGIVSALNRSITVASSAVPDSQSENVPDETDPGQQGPYDFWNFDLPDGNGESQQQEQAPSTQQSTISLSVIQTDAAINPGNSGGALLDSEGKLIGINVAIASAGSSSGTAGSIGVGFSIPSNLVKRVSDEIIANGSASHGLLGATVGNASAADGATTAGAQIQTVSPGGAAEAAGLKEGDIVTEFDGLPVSNSTDLTALVRTLPAGGEAELTYTRGDSSDTVSVTLGELAS